MKNTFKSIASLALTIIILIFLCSCEISNSNPGIKLIEKIENKITIPDLSGVEESIAKQNIIDKGLIPAIVYDYSDSIKEGNVIKTSPASGTSVNIDSKVTITVSKGPRSIYCKDATISWLSIDPYNKDDWSFYSPYIEDGYLMIKCEVIFGTSFSFKNTGFGNASLNGLGNYPFEITSWYNIPLTKNKEVKEGENVQLLLKIPVSQIDPLKPTSVECKIVCLVDGEQDNIEVGFNIVW